MRRVSLCICEIQIQAAAGQQAAQAEAEIPSEPSDDDDADDDPARSGERKSEVESNQLMFVDAGHRDQAETRDQRPEARV